jgi:diguanylate cyclase (GGDEF)-like protein
MAVSPGAEPLPSQPVRLRRASTGHPDAERAALTRVAAAAAGAHRLEDVLELVAEEARRAIGAASLSVSRWDRERDALMTLINVGELGPGERRFPEREAYPLADNPLVKRMLKEGQPYFNAVDDPSADPAAVELLRAVDKESDVAVPIVVDGETWGEVWAATSHGQPRFQATDVRFLSAIATRLAQVLRRAELFSRVSQMAYEDSLTGLANRRALLEGLEQAALRAAEGDSDLTVLICDVDGLKPINDARGHEAGDRALLRVAEALVAASARWPLSTVGRLSGDEFCVLLEGGDLQAAEEVAGSALTALGAERDSRLSISCGAAQAGPGLRTPDQLLRAADGAQYAAKRRGGGQFCTAAGTAAGMDADLFAPSDFAGDAIRGAAASALGVLDGSLREARALDRLEAVAMAFARAVNAASWAVSHATPRTGLIESLAIADDRDTRLRGLRVGSGDEMFSLGEFPATARLMRAGAGSFHHRRDDPGADPAEAALLEEMNRTAVLGAAASDLHGTWLVELFGDDQSASMAEAEQELSLLVRAALPAAAGAPLERRSHHLEVVSAITTALAELTDQEQILQACVNELQRAFGWPVCAVMRLREERIVVAAHAGRVGLSLAWSQPLNAGLIGRCMRELRPVVADDVRAEPDYREADKTGSIRSELDVPVLVHGNPWGVINLESDQPAAFDEQDIRLMNTVAELLGSALGSTALYERLERAYLGTAEALSAALEAKDSYTASHSHGIVSRAEAVGRLMGLEEPDLRELQLGAAFHDIGKLGIPEATLNKRGSVSRDERQLLEQHTVIGERILAPVEFLSGVLPLVRHAHERWDGYGYPDGLAGEDIPLGARIIFACDAWDAMTTDRPYRRAMNAGDAAEEMRRGAGSQFDPQVVEAVMQVVGPV